MKSSRAATDTPVVVAIFKAAFGMNERMEKARAVKMAFAKLIGGMAGAGLFVATATWGMAFCSSPGMSEQDVFVRLLASGERRVAGSVHLDGKCVGCDALAEAVAHGAGDFRSGDDPSGSVRGDAESVGASQHLKTFGADAQVPEPFRLNERRTQCLIAMMRPRR